MHKSFIRIHKDKNDGQCKGRVLATRTEGCEFTAESYQRLENW